MFGSYEVNERQLLFLSACSCHHDIYFFWHEYASETIYYGVVWNCLKAKNQHDFQHILAPKVSGKQSHFWNTKNRDESNLMLKVIPFELQELTSYTKDLSSKSIL